MTSFRNDDLSDYDKYDYSDLDEYYYTKEGGKVSYKNEFKKYYFLYRDEQGCVQPLVNYIECVYRITHGTFSPTEDSDWDYLGYTDLVSWDVLAVENSIGDEVKPGDVLTLDQLLEYTTSLETFVGD